METWYLTQENSERDSMLPKVYETATWIGSDDKSFIYSHALNRKLNPEEHSHEFFEIIYLFSGTAEHRVNGRIMHVDAGDVTVLCPGDTHLFVDQSDELELYSISSVPEEIQLFLRAYNLESEIQESKEPVMFHMNDRMSTLLLKYFHRLSYLPSQQEIDNMLRVILGRTMQEYVLLSLDQDRDWFQNILFHMRKPENMAEGVPAMMRLANLSHAQLCRTMKKLNLDPPKIYIKELRLSTAYELIVNTSLPLEEIALQVGYKSVSHFSASFKERYGFSPGVLRRQASSYLL